MVETVANWADIVGALGAVIAIGFAVVAQRQAAGAKRAITNERRRQFELEILRDLIEDLDQSDLLGEPMTLPGRMRRYRHRLELLPTSALPFWRQAATVTDLHDVPELTGMLDRIAKADQESEQERQRITSAGRATASANLDRLRADKSSLRREFAREVHGRLAADVHDAIKRRVDSEG